MKSQVNIFTEKLQELTRISAKISRATFNGSDLVNLQKLQASIDNLYSDGCIKYRHKKILWNLTELLLDEGREVIRLNESVKQIEKEIRNAERKHRREDRR